MVFIILATKVCNFFEGSRRQIGYAPHVRVIFGAPKLRVRLLAGSGAGTDALIFLVYVPISTSSIFMYVCMHICHLYIYIYAHNKFSCVYIYIYICTYIRLSVCGYAWSEARPRGCLSILSTRSIYPKNFRFLSS